MIPTLDPNRLARFVDPLPLPVVVRPQGDRAVPGVTFDTQSGQGLLVEWVNELPLKYYLPIDHSLHGAEGTKDLLVDRWGLGRHVRAAPCARTLAHNFVEQMAKVGLPRKATFRRDLRERVARYRQELLSTLDSHSNDILMRRATEILFEDAR